MTADAEELLEDPAVNSRKGIYEYLLGGKSDQTLLDVRIFDAKTKAAAYKRQTDEAKKKDVSNCPVCASGTNANRSRIYTAKEMEADHVTAWTKGGLTTLDNCEMLCKSHNRAKGNRWGGRFGAGAPSTTGSEGSFPACWLPVTCSRGGDNGSLSPGLGVLFCRVTCGVGTGSQGLGGSGVV